MDVSPKTLREVEFREKMRGYHPEDVDQFLERVAAGIEVLQDRLRQAIERAQRAEQAASEAGGNDDALRRTLLLAQRTADLAVQEAREQAARIIASAEQQTHAAVAEVDQRVSSVVGEAEHRAQATVGAAEQRAHAILADAEQRAHAMIADAEHRARRGHEDVLIEVRNDLTKLEMNRQRLQMDADVLARWVTDHRAQLRAALEDALTRMDQIDLSPPPPARPPAPLAATPVEARPSEVAASQPAPAEAEPPSQPEAEGEGNLQQLWAPPPADTGQSAAPAAEEPLGPWQPESDIGSDGGGDADPYFAELRRAISDPDPLAPRPEGDHQAATGGYAAEP